MSLKWFGTSLLSLTVVALCGGLAAAQGAPVVGQLVAERASIDGVTVPSGTTLLDGSLVGAGASPASIHLVSGHLLELGRNSSAVFQRGEAGEIHVRVASGTLSFREGNGEVATLPPDYEAVFAQRRSGQPVPSGGNGLVAVIAPAGGLQRAEQGQPRVPVNDSSRIQPTTEVLLRTSLSRTNPAPERYLQEVTCGIEAIRDNVVTLGEDLVFTYEPDDLVIQASRIPESKAYTRLKRGAGQGAETLEVEDSKQVNPLERIVLRHPNGNLREVACVRYTEEDLSQDADQTEQRSVVRIRAPLENAFPTGSEVIQGKRYDSERTVTSLDQRASSGQRVLRVKDPSAIDPLQQVLIRSADGRLFEAYCVYYVRGDSVYLAEDLDHDYPEGSEIIQGRSSQELIARGVALQRTANCCCCCDGGLVVAAIPWWKNPIIYFPIPPPVIFCSSLGCFGGPPRNPPPPPASQIAP